MKTALILSTVSTMIVAGLIGRAETAVTIYNQNFAVVRDVIPLDLKGGVNTIKHADTTFHLEPSSVVLRDRNETVRFYAGNAFDLVGERKRTDFRIDHSRRDVLETFEITIRNRKEAPAEVRVVEELYRWHNWEITAKTEPFVKVDSRTIEFRTEVGADQAKQINYTVHYTW